MSAYRTHGPNGIGTKHRHTTGAVLLAAVTALSGFSIQAQAAITTLVTDIPADKAAFLAATGATSATGPLPNLGGPWVSRTVGSVTFTALSADVNAQFFIGAATHPEIGDWYIPLPGNDIAINGPENIDVTFFSPVYSMGFDFAEPIATLPRPPPGGAQDSTFEVTLKSGGITVDTFQFNAPDDVISFIGVWSDTAFDRAEIREIIGGQEGEYFGEFYTGTTPLSGSILLSEDFNSENGGNRQDIYFGFTNWDVTDGSVDLRHRTDFGLTPPTDQVVDLDGGTLDAGRLESKATFTLDPGIAYELRFDLAGNQRIPGTDTVTVSLANVFSEDFTLSQFDPFTTIVREIVVATPASGTLVFDHAGGDNIGLLLDNVHLIRKEASALVDHFQCYKAKGEPPYVAVDLEDQFGLLAGVFVEQPEFFCNPVDKNGEGILNPTAHLTCYKIRAENEKRGVVVDNQFGEQPLETQKPELLCVPSNKIEVIR
jgi:hypothetical protein